MTIDFTKPFFLMPDGSYVVTTKNPVYPYNVLSSDPLWPSVQAWLAAGNKVTLYAPPKAAPATDEQIDAQVKAEIIADYLAKTITEPVWVERKQVLTDARNAERAKG